MSAREDPEQFKWQLLAANILHQAIWDQENDPRIRRARMPFWSSTSFVRLCDFCGVEQEAVLNKVRRTRTMPFPSQTGQP